MFPGSDWFTLDSLVVYVTDVLLNCLANELKLKNWGKKYKPQID